VITRPGRKKKKLATPLYTTKFNMQKFYILSAEGISAFCTEFKTISYYFPVSLTDCFLERRRSVFTVRHELSL
jgi:hypothetical protein